MYISYRVVWVSRECPDIVENYFEDGIEDIEKAKETLEYTNSIPDDDGLNWFARIQRVTHEFI
jgi:hypothetical protein